MRTLHYSEDAGNGRRYAINMRYCVLSASGAEIYRGPYWRAKMIANGAMMTFGEVR